MKRAYILSIVAIGMAIFAATGLNAQTPAPAPAAAAVGRGTAVFNVARVMKDYQKWQYFAQEMNKERQGRGAELAKLRNDIIEMETKIKNELVATQKAMYEQTFVNMQRQFEDKERNIRKEIDDKSAAHLRQLFAEIRTVVEAVAKTNGFDLVMSYPDALTEEEMRSPLYYDLKLRPPAAMPFYVSPNVDLTSVVVKTLNANFPAPGKIDAAPAASAPMGAAPAIVPTGGMK